MADACEPLRTRLRALEIELADSKQVPGEQHAPKPPAQLNALIRQIAATRAELQACVESRSPRRFTVTGESFRGAYALDAVIRRWMFDHDIRALSVAIAHDGAVLGKRGYTWALPDYPITQPDTLFRVASVSKLFTCAAVDRLVATGALSFDTRAFPYLGVAAPPLLHVDPDMDNITVRHLAMRQSGLRDDVEGDMRAIAKLFSMTTRPTLSQVLEYIYMTPLVARPGTGDNYSNPAFTVLGAIVEKASGMSLIEYLRRELLAPLGISDVHVGGTLASARRANEVATYDAASVSPSHLDFSDGATANDAHGGRFALESDVAAGGLIMSTATIARFLRTHAVWNIGAREVGGRYGKLAGSGAIAVSREDPFDFAVAFNRDVEYAAYDALTMELQKIIDDRLVLTRATLDTVATKFVDLIEELVDAVREVVSRRIVP